MRQISKFVVVGFAAACCGGHSAMAADFFGSALRGSIAPPAYQEASPWDGFYVGGSAAYSSGDFKPRTSGYSVVAPQLNGTAFDAAANLNTQLSPRNTSASDGAYGGFVGYNTTWEDVVLGIEADYQRTNLKAGSTISIGRQVIDSLGVNDSYTANSQIASNITDIATVRGRVGYAFGDALPYLTLGVGIIHGKSSVNTTIDVSGVDTATPPVYQPFTAHYQGGYRNRDKWAVGLAAGAGVDYALTRSIFLRAEYQYLRFTSFDGTEVNLNNAKVGVAAKF
ncbi:MAG: outer membrane beta-barrel protein [Beijerinckiaceae bacterium]|nr:outer membrane beta-barrel protein [Beijerinckiaceae bacterium]